MKKIFYISILFTVLLTGCSKPVDSNSTSQIQEPEQEVLTWNAEVEQYGNTLANINDGIGSGRILETIDSIYYAYDNSIIKIDRITITNTELFVAETDKISNLAYYDGFIYYLVSNSNSAQLNRISLDSNQKEMITSDISPKTILVIMNDSLYFTNTLSYFVKTDLTGNSPKLFGYTMVSNPKFDGQYFYGTGYDLTASTQWLRIYQTDPATDKSKLFYEGNEEAYSIYPSEDGYLVLTHSNQSDTNYHMTVLDQDGKIIEELISSNTNPLGSIKENCYYFMEDSTAYQFDLTSNQLSSIDSKSGKYSIWLINAYGLETTDYIFYNTSSGNIEAYSKKENKIIQVYSK